MSYHAYQEPEYNRLAEKAGYHVSQSSTPSRAQLSAALPLCTNDQLPSRLVPAHCEAERSPHGVTLSWRPGILRSTTDLLRARQPISD